MRYSTVQAFQNFSRPIKTVTSFKYLGRIITASDNKYPSVVGNLRKARDIWAHLAKILGREGYIPKVLKVFFNEFVQAVPFFGS